GPIWARSFFLVPSLLRKPFRSFMPAHDALAVTQYEQALRIVQFPNRSSALRVNHKPAVII
ncbi:MAG: hypothetical protein ACREX0_14390, partial [Noviherbaspirillum sp.]